MSSRYTIFSLIIHSIFYSFLYFYNDPKNILTTKTDFPPKIISINLVDITYNSNLKEKKKQSHNNKNKEPNTTKTDSSWNKTINKLNNEAIEKKSNQTDNNPINEKPTPLEEESLIKEEDILGQSMPLIKNQIPSTINSDLIKIKNIENDSESTDKKLNTPKLIKRKRKIKIKNETLATKYTIPKTKPNNKKNNQTNDDIFETNKNVKKGLESNKLLKSLDISDDITDDTDIDDPNELELERDIIKKTDIKYSKNIADGLSIVDTIRSSFIKCWTIPYGSKGIKDITIKINIKLDENGNVLKLRVINNNQKNQNKQIYKLMLQSAIRAIYKCTPISILPKEKFNAWNDIDLSFNPKDSL